MGTGINEVFREALESFVEKAKRDEQIIAVILLGSMSYDQVWEKSDIDLRIVVEEQKLVMTAATFMENGIPINAGIQTRNDFKRWVERSVQGAFAHSYLRRGTVLFTKDPTIEEYFRDISRIGNRDRQLLLLQLSCFVLASLAKAEKWYVVKRDPVYSAFWIIKMVDVLAQIEVIRHGEVPMREAVKQALAVNPAFFEDIYTGLIRGEATEEKVKSALALIHGFIEDRALQLFGPVLNYLKKEQEFRSMSELSEKLSAIIRLDAGLLVNACDWLAERGYIAKIPMATKATPKSRIVLEEPGYLYEDEDDLGGEW
jgi:hypothetical protein